MMCRSGHVCSKVKWECSEERLVISKGEADKDGFEIEDVLNFGFFFELVFWDGLDWSWEGLLSQEKVDS
eukprot:CAMPEP_0168352976 /NCGR_PEP_ID=MMETSP0213-20121227/22921_1 /TAXON_ID=151035 /ORGANISM="Euplotes harpa, Strain FSP1.4" /LENGTH=68 /DNA_ID=CAMNT_0008364389 /DNA_START=9 /DNA_END=215 /DNA_ORIENTATION=+